MAKKDDGGGLPQPDETRNPASENPPQNNSAAHDALTFRAVEEHATALGVSAPVFAAVKVANGWNAGKKVEKTEFEKAVNSFLKAPMGGS